MSQASAPRGKPEAATPTLLRTAYNHFSAGLFSQLARAGYSDLRPAHGNVMEPLAVEDGLRLSDLAHRAGMAPQSIGELVDDLAVRGYVERREDPEDRRAKRIHLTQKGRDNVAASRRALVRMERRLEQRLGSRQYQQLRRALASMVDDEA